MADPTPTPTPAQQVKTLLDELKAKQEALATDQAAHKAEIEEGKKAANSKLDGLEKRIDEIQTIMADLAKAMAGSCVSLPGLEAEAKEFSLAKAFTGITMGRWHEGFEKRVLEEAAKSSQNTANASGGYVIPVEVSAMIIETLTSRTVMDKLGIQTIQFDGSTKVHMPKETATMSAYWEGEETALQKTVSTFGEFQLAPHRIGAFVPVSKRLLSAAPATLETFLRSRLLGAIARKIDLGAIEGDGTGNIPNGLIKLITDGDGSTISATNRVTQCGPDATHGGNFDFDKASDLIGIVEDWNGLREAGEGGAPAFLAVPKIWRQLRKQRIDLLASGDGLGEYVAPMGPIMSVEKLREMLGYDFQSTTSLTTSLTKTATGLTRAIFGDWARFIMGVWQTLVISASDQTGNATGSAFLQNQVWLKAEGEVDFGIEQAAAFAAYDDVNSTWV